MYQKRQRYWLLQNMTSIVNVSNTQYSLIYLWLSGERFEGLLSEDFTHFFVVVVNEISNYTMLKIEYNLYRDSLLAY